MKIGLVACCGMKLPYKAQAKDLYVSPLFRLSRLWVEQRCDRWFILSAKYGLLSPDTEIEPYDITLLNMSPEEVRGWASRTRESIMGLLPADMIVLAGERYLMAVEGLEYDAPLRGLSIGKRLQKLSDDLRRSRRLF